MTSTFFRVGRVYCNEMCSVAAMTFWEPLRRRITRGRVDAPYSRDYPHYVTENRTVHTRVHSLLWSWIMSSDRLPPIWETRPRTRVRPWARRPSIFPAIGEINFPARNKHHVIARSVLQMSVYSCRSTGGSSVPPTNGMPRRRSRNTSDEIGSTDDWNRCRIVWTKQKQENSKRLTVVLLCIRTNRYEHSADLGTSRYIKYKIHILFEYRHCFFLTHFFY